MTRLLFIFGTRPEAIKLAPVILRMRRQPGMVVHVCATAQHRGMLDQVLELFEIAPEYDLDVMCPGQTLFQSTSRIIGHLEAVFQAAKYDMVVVQGDTTTTLCGALAGFYAGVPVAHVEAGLRTGDLQQPFPEELNRVLTSRIAALHFPPTENAARRLISEGVPPGTILVTGNTVIDAIHHILDALKTRKISTELVPPFEAGRKLILVTAHRRESFGEPFERIVQAVDRIAQRPDVAVAWPVHPNPSVQEVVNRALRNRSNIRLMEPLSYIRFVELMSRSHLLLSDSGGVQEEGPALRKPVLVMREKTERPEGVAAGAVKLVGTDPAVIVEQVERLLDSECAYHRMSSVTNPYGDGHASARIAVAITSFLNVR
jgi:UDP-N-acetylglucosamine 2-epimerase (non-hydrolysing)